MSRIAFPKQLRRLLRGSPLEAPLRYFADRVGEILADNKLPFFPYYTDHGIHHVNRVLQTEESLIPITIWKHCSTTRGNSRALCDADAVILIGATLLHDIAMHIQPSGFLELIASDSRFQPLNWFKDEQEGHPPDRQWKELWQEYMREARRFGERTLANIVGHLAVRRGWRFHDLPENHGNWELNHLLIIGEFLRRHHARLAHEIAIYGFPGLEPGSGEQQFVALGRTADHPLAKLADLIGVTARSHGTSLRLCKTYLDSNPLYRAPRPLGAAVLYPMALLRVADYLQLDRQRAPAVLLQLRQPQSPVSVQEWAKHRAIEVIGAAMDPKGVMITVSQDISLKLYLQIQELIEGLQREMDHSTAVLDEIYGNLAKQGLSRLALATRRVYSNLSSIEFRNSLPYIPSDSGFEADPSVLPLLVEPLYGKYPEVAVREIIQNGIDAVLELNAWCSTHNTRLESLAGQSHHNLRVTTSASRQMT